MKLHLMILGAILCLSPRIGLAAPTVQTAPVQGKARVGQSTEVIYQVSWDGPIKEALFLPPALPELNWGAWEVTRSEASTDPKNIYTVAVAVTPAEAGAHTLPPVTISYVVPDDKGETPLEELPTHSADSGPLELDVLEADAGRATPWLALGGGIGAALAVILFVAYGLRKREDGAIDGRPLREQVQDAMHAAQRHRLDGDFYSFYKELTRVAEWTARDAEDKRRVEALRARTQAVGYRGVRPAEDELNGDQKDIERAVARWQEESEQ